MSYRSRPRRIDVPVQADDFCACPRGRTGLHWFNQGHRLLPALGAVVTACGACTDSGVILYHGYHIPGSGGFVEPGAHPAYPAGCVVGEETGGWFTPQAPPFPPEMTLWEAHANEDPVVFWVTGAQPPTPGGDAAAPKAPSALLVDSKS